jgi:Fe-S oxidoreductase
VLRFGGTYNILQPDIADRLRDRKVANIATVRPDMIAAGNIGCITQIAHACQRMPGRVAGVRRWSVVASVTGAANERVSHRDRRGANL